MVDYERQLLASWLNGYNLEHIKEFDHFMFYPRVFEAVKQSERINPMNIAIKSDVPVKEIAKIITEHMPSMYEGAYRIAKEEKIKAMLLETAKNPNNIAKQLETILSEIENMQTHNVKEPTDLCDSYKKELAKRKEHQPLIYGIPDLDYITGGIRRQELTVIAARPSIGKTAFALQTAFKIALTNEQVLFFPLEMSGSQIVERLVCRETDIKHQRLKTPSKMDKKDDAALERFYAESKESITDYLKVIEGVSYLSDIKRHIQYYKPKVVFIDQLSQLKEYKKFNSIREQFSYMTNALKSMSMELDIPIVLLAQINRAADNKEPTLADLKESGSIEEDSDNVIMIHQTEASMTTTLPMALIVRKQRNGQRDRQVSVRYIGEKFKFEV